jgi:hypothetical protein
MDRAQPDRSQNADQRSRNHGHVYQYDISSFYAFFPQYTSQCLHFFLQLSIAYALLVVGYGTVPDDSCCVAIASFDVAVNAVV